VKRLPLLALFCLPVLLHAQADPLDWVNGARRNVGAPAVAADALLSRTAQLWAERLAAAGVLTHHGDDGSTGLDRYRAQGGTEVRVGEIIGAGPGMREIEKGWMASPEHRELALLSAWTHAGWGSAVSGNARVTVMMFTEKRVQPFLIARNREGITLSGTFTEKAAAGAVLYNGLAAVDASAWDPVSRSFLFAVGDAGVAGYLRLGYVTAAGLFVLTNAFTWPPGTGSPGAPGRSAEPAPSP
jgi:hypothetical protein